METFTLPEPTDARETLLADLAAEVARLIAVYESASGLVLDTLIYDEHASSVTASVNSGGVPEQTVSVRSLVTLRAFDMGDGEIVAAVDEEDARRYWIECTDEEPVSVCEVERADLAKIKMIPEAEPVSALDELVGMERLGQTAAVQIVTYNE